MQFKFQSSEVITNMKQIMLLKHILQTNYALKTSNLQLGKVIDKPKVPTNNCKKNEEQSDHPVTKISD